MSMRSRFLAVIGLLVVAGPAHAAAGGVMDLVFQWVNFALLLGVIVYFARKPIQSFFADRRTQIANDLEESARLLEAAETRYADWQRAPF